MLIGRSLQGQQDLAGRKQDKTYKKVIYNRGPNTIWFYFLTFSYLNVIFGCFCHFWCQWFKLYNHTCKYNLISGQ